MTNQLTTEINLSNKARPYTPEEDLFLKSAVEVAKQYSLSVSEVAATVCDMIGRTKAAVERRMGSIKNGKFPEDYFENIEKTFYDEKSVSQRLFRVFDASDIGEEVRVTVTRIMPYGAFCSDNKGRSGLLNKRHISRDFVHDVADYLKVGDTLDVKIIPDRNGEVSKVELSARAIGDIVPIREKSLVN